MEYGEWIESLAATELQAENDTVRNLLGQRG